MFGGETFKNFAINFNAQNARGSFSAGDSMSGHMTFALSKETKITSMTMSLRGAAKVTWTTTSGSGKRRRRHNHTERLEFFDLPLVVLPHNAVGHTRLQPGNHMYPFTCQIPQGDFPSTFHGFNGNITYSLRMAIHRPWHMAKEFETEVNFVSHVDANHPYLLAPLAGANSRNVCCLWWVSGPISMNVRVERKGFVPGESVKIICEVSNGSSGNVTPRATLSQKLQLIDRNNVTRRTHLKDLGTVRGTTVNGGSLEVHSEMLLPIPADTALTIANCSILKVDYNIDVSLRSRGSSELTVLVPIVLCDIPVSDSAPPPY